MSLQYVIDGYNLINHPLFSRHKKHGRNIQSELLAFIKIRRLTGSAKNRIALVFDGYPPSLGVSGDSESVTVIFSRKISADEKIKRIVEETASRKNIIVVTDDKEIGFAVKALGAGCIAVGDFIEAKEDPAARARFNAGLEPELNYTQMEQINRELKKIWLKE